MNGCANKKSVLLAGISLAVLSLAVSAGSAQAQFFGQQQYYRPYGNDPGYLRDTPTRTKRARNTSPTPQTVRANTSAKTDKPVKPAAPVVGPGPYMVIVSIEKQRATLFANGVAVADTGVSTGTPGHPTPMGLFTVIQKNRHHVSNLYNAPMPYMQRITWSGSALHEGALPGYPASHGCIRLSQKFADLLWNTTQLGARVIVTRAEVAPADIVHPKLFAPKPAVAAETPRLLEQRTNNTNMTVLVKTADASDALRGTVLSDSPKPETTAQATSAEPAPASGAAATPPVTEAAAQPAAPSAEVATTPATTPATIPATPEPAAQTAAPAPAAAPEAQPIVTGSVPAAAPIEDENWTLTEGAPGAKDLERRAAPVSVFISRKDQKLYVRQANEPVFDLPIKIQDPQQPIGTHLYTAMELTNSGSAMRWTSVSIPSNSSLRSAAPRTPISTKKGAPQPVVSTPVDPSKLTAASALDRLELPQIAIDRISQLMTPGSSLIVSDNGISKETAWYKGTDFIILTE